MKTTCPDVGEYVLPALPELPGDLAILAGALLPVLGDETLTVRAVLAVSDAMPGVHIYIRGYARDLRTKERRRLIRAAYDGGGVTVTHLAMKYRLSRSAIEKILASPDEK